MAWGKLDIYYLGLLAWYFISHTKLKNQVFK